MSATNAEPRQFVLLKHFNHIAEGTSIKATRTKQQMLEAGEMGATTRFYSLALSVASMKRSRQVTHLTRQSRQLTFCQGAFVLVGGVFCAPPLFRNNFWIGAEYQHETCMLSGRVWNGLDRFAGLEIQSSPNGFGLDWIIKSHVQRILDWTGLKICHFPISYWKTNYYCHKHITFWKTSDSKAYRYIHEGS